MSVFGFYGVFNREIPGLIPRRLRRSDVSSLNFEILFCRLFTIFQLHFKRCSQQHITTISSIALCRSELPWLHQQ